ncbi:MAG: ATP-binding protein, partial [Bacteroidetes bacterium]|nr:ATP-binding protein [Bacteroidota bacterium]
MGWGRNTKDPLQFSSLIKNFNELDLNSIYLNYNEERGFGQMKTIDVWWRGAGNNFTLEMTLVRFLTSNPDWRDANVRFLIISNFSSVVGKAYKNLNQILEQYRVIGEIKVINNEIEQRRSADIIKAESASADLTIFGIPDVTEEDAAGFIETINNLTNELGTTLFVHASSYFDEIDVGIKKEYLFSESSHETFVLPEIRARKNVTVEKEVVILNSKYESLLRGFFDQCADKLVSLNKSPLIELKNEGIKIYDKIRDVNKLKITSRQKDALYQLRREAVSYSEKICIEQSAAIEDFTDFIKENIEYVYSKEKKLVSELPQRLIIHYDKEELKNAGTSGLGSKLRKAVITVKTIFSKSPISVPVKFSEFANNYIQKSLANHFIIFLNELERISYKLASDLHNSESVLISSIDRFIAKLNGRESATHIKNEEEKFTAQLNEHLNLAEQNLIKVKTELLKNARNNMQDMVFDLERIDANSILRRDRRVTKQDRRRNESSSDFPKTWQRNLKTLLSTVKTDLMIEKLKGVGFEETLKIENDLRKIFTGKYTNLLNNSAKTLDDIETGKLSNQFDIQIEKDINLQSYTDRLAEVMRSEITKLPEEIEVIGENFSEAVETIRFDEGDTAVISIRKLVDFSFESEFVGVSQAHTVNYQRALRRAIGEARDVINLVNFNLQTVEEDKESADEEMNLSLLAGRMRECSEMFTKVQDEYLANVKNSFAKAFEPLTSYSILKSASELSAHVRELGGKKVISKFTRKKEAVYNYFQNILVRLFYKRSEGILFAKQIDELQAEEFNSAELLTFTAQLTPEASLIEKLPHYYKKLFGGSSSVSGALWVGRKTELEKCRQAFERFNSGYTGGLLILGQRNDGKSALSKKIAEMNFEPDNIFTL